MFAFEAAASAESIRPWRPAHLRARRTEAGIALSWIRRTRIGGDAWEAFEVPLSETSEAYRVEILDGEAVLRMIETQSPAALYSNADEIADFGAPQSVLALRVAQFSAAAGFGRARNAVISL